MALSLLFNVMTLLLANNVASQDCQDYGTAGHRIHANTTEDIMDINNTSDQVHLLCTVFQYREGCFPYPAVDPQTGNNSGGLKNSGLPGDDCCDKKFMLTYARMVELNQTRGSDHANVAVLYSNFFPKDMPRRFTGGHRYDWDEVVVFADKDYKPIKAALFFHGKYLFTLPGSDDYWCGDRVIACYTTNTICNNVFEPCDRSGGHDPPIRLWSTLTDKESCTLQNADFGSASLKMKDTDNTFSKRVHDTWNEETSPIVKQVACRVHSPLA